MEDRIQTPTTDQSPSPLTNTNNIFASGPQFGNSGTERSDNIFSGATVLWWEDNELQGFV